jgi:AbrB family looped-hinge helix DNA binding protein
MKTKISSKGQIVLPAELRQQDRIRTGQQFEVERLAAGQYLLKKVSKQGKRGGLFEWLQACPEKDWFEPLTSESTDDLGWKSL